MREHPTYDGIVTPGGPSQARTLGELTIRKLAVSAMHNNVYLLSARDGSQILIDAADDAPAVLELIGRGGPHLDAIVTTHRHWDHVRALAEVAATTGARTYAGAEDAADLPAPTEVLLEHGDQVRAGAIVLDVVQLDRVHLFTGDALFPGGVGNTKQHGQDFETLYADVTQRVFDVYDDRTIVYPGHGADTVLGAERPQLQQWRERGW